MLKKLSLNSLLTSIFLLPTLAISTYKAEAHPLDFTFRNLTASPVSQLYVSSTNTDSWEEDVLGRDILSSGQSVDINFNGDYDSCLFDIKAVFPDDSYQEEYGFNLCETSQVTLD
ncbi:hypothetical protein Sta7437_4468 [Stanieria cyanosphaera PCC 7437]|uniref:Argininosuccinate lyase n=1 Tax=Stanieria cyanosphaera (strain ATCC 29371 / PCC 7437) TaxID=111780 RepID=K9Y1R5_STAC7|nr:hypothetical protein [Stanieria cyanosphaera]AFZ37932.1 hypothetical protein Sta7437_4468 [Stanieria cyanosphaera PCC 7437]